MSTSSTPTATAHDASAFDTSAWMPVSVRPPQLMLRGAGSFLWDAQGRRYLDFVQGWAVNCLGHCPTVVQQALAEQAALLLNASPAYHTAPQLTLARELCSSAGLHHAFFCSSGAEANEAAIKLARKWGQLQRNGASEIITTLASFHGRTLATMAASGKPGWEHSFAPRMPGFVHVPFGDVEAVARAIHAGTVAVMVEPIQGEAGVIVPPPGYLKALRELSRARGVLLILDEVQTGMGRTGTLFAAQHDAVTPDLMTLGKGLGGGVPLAALLATREASCFAPGDQGGTFSGHPLMTAVGLAVLRALLAPGFLSNVQAAGHQLRSELSTLTATHGVHDVRGRGLLCALSLPVPKARAVADAALRHGLLINAPQASTLRFMPALNVSAAELDQLLPLLRVALDEGLAS